MGWYLAAGFVPAATLVYGFGSGQPDPTRWLVLSVLAGFGMLYVAVRR